MTMGLIKRWACCLTAVATMSVQAEEANYFLLSYLPGPSWNDSVSYEKQPGLQKHHEYLKELHVNDTIVMGGAVLTGDAEQLSLMLVRTGSLEEAKRIADQDPGVQMRLVRASVLPWDVNMSSMRFVRRQPLPRIVDEDQSFSLKRIDPETRLNIEE